MEAAGEILPPFCVSGAAVARVCGWGGEEGTGLIKGKKHSVCIVTEVRQYT